jgi:hypothetical protein
MYDYSGNWVYDIGVPAKSGLGGGIVGVANRQLGIGPRRRFRSGRHEHLVALPASRRADGSVDSQVGDQLVAGGVAPPDGPHAETDCMAGHIGLEPANPSASAWRLIAFELRCGEYAGAARISAGVAGAKAEQYYGGGWAKKIIRSPRSPAEREMIRLQRIWQQHCSVCAGLSTQRERLW